MTYITLSTDMSLRITKSTAIYRGDNLNTAIAFLLPKKIDNIDLQTATVFLSYIRADGEPDMVILENAGGYDLNFYSYVLPVTCKLSRYSGQVCMWLQICDGNSHYPIISKTGECTIRIHESKSLDNCIGDHQLIAMYQLKRQYDSMAEKMEKDCTWDDMDSSPDEDSSLNESENHECVNPGEIWEDM